MKFEKAVDIKDLAARIGAEIKGDTTLSITGINEIHKVEPGDVVFVDHEKYYEKVINSKASAIIIDKEVPFPEGKALLICDEPFFAYNQLAKEMNPVVPLQSAISSDLKVGEGTIIEKGAFIASNVVIGKNCHIHAGAYIGKDTVIGDEVNIQPAAIIGSDAFYFNKKADGFHQWRSVGRVVLESRVYIGSGSTINRGVSGDTIIGEGTKIDCLVQIGHGVVVGKHCLFAAQVGIGGKTIVGDHVTMYGQVGIAQRLKIGSHAVILAKSGVSKDLEGHKTYFGYPASEVREKYKELAALRNLPEFMKNQ